MPGGQDAAALAVGDDRQPPVLGEVAGGLLGPVHPHVGAEHQHRALGLGEQPGDGGQRLGVGFEGGRGSASRPGASGDGREQVVHVEVEEDRPAVRRDGRAEGRSRRPGRSSRRRSAVNDSLVIGSSSGGWSISCRAPQPQRERGARPPMTTTGEPLKCAVATPLTPLVMPGPGGQHGQPGCPGQPGGGLRGEHRALLVAHVEDPHALVHGAVVEREDVPARQGEHGLDTVGLGDGDGDVTGVLRRLHAGNLPTSHQSKQMSTLGSPESHGGFTCSRPSRGRSPPVW